MDSKGGVVLDRNTVGTFLPLPPLLGIKGCRWPERQPDLSRLEQLETSDPRPWIVFEPSLLLGWEGWALQDVCPRRLDLLC